MDRPNFTLHSIVCNENEFECKDGVCIVQDRVCDQYKDCTGGEDEDPSLCMSTTIDIDNAGDDSATEYPTEQPTNIDNGPESCK